MNKDGNIGATAEFTGTPQAWPSDGERLAVSADALSSEAANALEAVAAAKIAAMGATPPASNAAMEATAPDLSLDQQFTTPAFVTQPMAEPAYQQSENIPAAQPAPVPATPVVRSAKDAINAMYAAGGTSLGSYLASTAPNQVSPKPTADAKSASSLHHKSTNRKMESTRPSASALFRMAKSKSERTAPPRPTVNAADPLLESHAVTVVQKSDKSTSNKRTISVVSTSLKLAPKKPPIVVAPREPRRISDQVTINPAKGTTKLARKLAINQGTKATASVAHVQKAAAAALKKSTTPTVPRPKKPASRRGAPFQDVVRPAAAPKSYQLVEPAPTAAPQLAAKKPKLLGRSNRSVKERFRPAPKGYAKTEAEQFKSQNFVDFSNPDHAVKAQHLNLPAPSSVDLYAGDFKPPLAKVQSVLNAGSGLGVVKDYRPRGDSLTNSHIAEAQVASGHGGRDESAPDNNRYALGGQSPFFLKTVQVEKRPLSDGPVYGRGDSGGTLYNAPKAEPRTAKKNVYEKKAPKKVKAKKPKKTPKSNKNVLRQNVPTRPTVIIPPSRRGHAPLFLLLLLTVILGATVGALAYLCFFQSNPLDKIGYLCYNERIDPVQGIFGMTKVA